MRLRNPGLVVAVAAGLALSTGGAVLQQVGPSAAAAGVAAGGHQIAVARHQLPIPRRLPIALIDTQGEVIAELPVPAGYHDVMPAWSPDGGRLAFLRNRTAPDGNGLIYSRVMVVRVDPAGRAVGAAKAVSAPPKNCNPMRAGARNCFASSPAWSPGGGWIAYSLDDGRIHLVKPNGRGERTVPGARIRSGSSYPAWLPDGRIAFSYNPMVRADWPDICRERGTRGCGRVWIQRLDGTGQRKFVKGRDAHWSADGRSVVLTGSNGGVYTVPATGGAPRMRSRGYLAEWSADGSRIVYAKMGEWPRNKPAPNPDSVWMMDPDGTGHTQLLVGATDPAWRP